MSLGGSPFRFLTRNVIGNESMATLNIKPAGSAKYDLVALGEVMLRFDPGEGRVRTAREFKVWEGGGEYNVARGLRRCFGLKTAVCTAFADNDVGRLLEDFILQGGVETEFIRWVPYDGEGRTVRAVRWVFPIADIPRRASSSPVILIGTISSANSARAGCIPAEYSPRSATRRPSS